MGSLSNTWGLDVFTASTLIRDSRVLTCTTFRYSSPLSSLLLLVLKPFFQNPAGERSPSHLPDPSSYLALLPDDLGGPLPEGCPVPQPPPCSRRHPVLPLPSQLGCPSRGDFQERVSESKNFTNAFLLDKCIVILIGTFMMAGLTIIKIPLHIIAACFSFL